MGEKKNEYSIQLYYSFIEEESESSSICRTTLSDQYLRMMLENTIRFHDPTIVDTYLHVLSYLIDTLSKTSDDNFCSLICSLLSKYSIELTYQLVEISTIYWHVWSRCSIHLITILNRTTHTIELNNQQQTITLKLLICPFSFGDNEHLDYSYTLIWTQLFQALCRLILLNGHQLINLYSELFHYEFIFEQTINNENNQRLFGFILVVIKCLLKNFMDINFKTISKRLLTQCSIKLSIIIDTILERFLSTNMHWSIVCSCLLKSNKISFIDEQSKSFVFTYVRDLIIDLLHICRTSLQLELILTHLKQILPFLIAYEEIIANKSDHVLLNRIITTINSLYESSNGLSLLQLSYPLLIFAFQHHKISIRNKIRKCWNETFGHLKFIIYPDELRFDFSYYCITKTLVNDKNLREIF